MPTTNPKESGWIEVICGSMFSGKSEELIRRLRRAQIARQAVGIFKPKVDTRFSEDHIVSHSEHRMEAQIVESAEAIIKKTAKDELIAEIKEQISDK